MGKPTGFYIDTEHPEIDEIISEAWNRLGRYRAAVAAYENARDHYLRSRARAESGRLPRYGNPLGVRVSSSGGGHSEEDVLLDLVDEGRRVDDLRRDIALGYAATDAMIRSSVSYNSRPGVALRAEFLSTDSISLTDLCDRFPKLYGSRGSAAYWKQKGFNHVCHRIRDEHDDRDRCCDELTL